MLAKIKKIRFVNVFWLFFYLLVFGLLLKNSLAGLDPDFGWHLKVGEEISLSGEVPSSNTYNYTYQGGWVDHEWLADLAIFHVYQAIGYSGLAAVFSFIVLLTLILLTWFTNQRSKNSHYLAIASLQFFGVVASLPHFGVRVQELALLFLLFLLIILFFCSRQKSPWVILLLVPLFFVWANLHASFLLGLFLIFTWLIVKGGEMFLLRTRLSWLVSQTSKLSWQKMTIFFGVALSAAGSTLLTPYRLELYSFLSGYQNKAYLNLIQEWRPQYFFPFHYDQIIFLALGLAALIIYLYQRLTERRSLDWWQLFLVVTFLVLGITSRRHFPLFFIVSLPFLAQVYSSVFFALQDKLNKFLKIVVLVCLFLTAITPFFVLRPVHNPFIGFCQEYPCGAVDFLRAKPEYLSKRIFNNYGWGGFLIFVLPEQKLFIDGRLPQVEFAGHTFIEEYFSFFREEAIIERQLSVYEIELVLINSRDKITRLSLLDQWLLRTNAKSLQSKNRLRDYLDKQEQWQKVYDDGTASIYIRRQAYED